LLSCRCSWLADEIADSRSYACGIAIIGIRLFSGENLLLEDMAHKELGICPQSLDEPLGNAMAIGMAHVIAGLNLVLPYVILLVVTAMARSSGVPDPATRGTIAEHC
jgi:hypothetical protein